MSHPMIFTRRIILAMTGVAFLISGCAKPAKEVNSGNEEPAAATSSNVSQTDAEDATSHPLVGVWLGRGAIDRNSVAAATDGLSAEAQRQVKTAAEVFVATEMAIEFKDDGMMETAVEIVNQSGKRESGVGIAAWEASQTVQPGEFRVVSVEEQEDGSAVTDYKTYRVSDDGQTLALLVDLPGVLGQCQPRIVFQKQTQQPRIAKELQAWRQ